MTAANPQMGNESMASEDPEPAETVSTAGRVSVAGATGYLGQWIVRELAARGRPVDALARSAAKVSSMETLGARGREVRATDPESVAGCFEGVRTVVSALGITRQKDGLSYDDVDYQANLNLLREAERAGVEKFVYVSVIGGRDLRHTALVDAKERFVDALRESPIASCVIRPTGFFSDLEAIFEMACSGRVWVFGKGDQKLNPIHGADLAVAIVDALDGDDDEVVIGGPDVLTAREMGALAFEALGKTPRITGVPVSVARGAAATLRWVTPRSVWGPVQFFVAGATQDAVAPCTGTRHLADHYAQLAAERGRSADGSVA